MKKNLKLAIQNRNPIIYNCTGNHDFGERYGYPHIVFSMKRGGNVLVDIFKLEGVETDLRAGSLPAWRRYRLKDVVIVDVFPEKFRIQKSYNRRWSGYKNVLVEVGGI